MVITEVNILMGLFGVDVLFTEEIDKLKVELSYARVAKKRDMVSTTPVGDIVHAHPGIPAEIKT